MPGLLDLKTDLKSLKYGSDRPGGGDSGLPYIKTDINTVDSGFNRFRLTKFDDGLIRGGAIGALNASVADTLRIGKFLTDIPKGPLFIVKQVGLQLSNPQLETKQISINRGGLFGGIVNLASRINNVVGPTRIYNLGINTLAQIPVNAFGAHFNRHGLLPVQSEDTKYFSVVQANNENNANRLVGYKDKFSLGDNKGNQTQDNRITNALVAGINAVNSILRPILGVNVPQIPNIKQDPKQLTIDSYLGGPGSVYGIGNTTIRRYSFTEDATKIKNSLEVGNANNRLANTDLDKNLSRDLVKNGPSSYPNILPPSIPGNVYGNLKTYKAISERNQLSTREAVTNDVLNTLNAFGIGVPINNNKPDTSNQFRIIASDTNGPIKTEKGIGFSTTNLPNKITYKNTYGDLVTVNKSSWSAASREVRIGNGRIDSINLTPLFTAKGGQDSLVVNIKGVNYTINDLAKFRIEAINTDKPDESTFMVFRAYITAFDDSTNANWDAIKYIGRGEEFYIYNGFNRKINISFKVAALSAKEMEPMYQKLNFLMSNLMPDYNNLLMRGPMTKMTVGNWIDSQPGVINSLSYTISNDSPWEIALNEPIPGSGGKKEMVLPHIIDVNLSFTPIGVHTKGTYQTPRKSTIQSNIAQNWNGSNEKSNYISTSGSFEGKVGGEPNQIY
jgi:hypothetical protein